MTLASPARRIERVRHDIQHRTVTVVRKEQLSPGFLAISFAGDSLDSFISLSFDDHVKFIVSDATGTPCRRDFTPRHIDLPRRELTLEFALHAQGVASDWARAAAVGDTAVIAGPRGSMIIPMDCDWHLLMGDASALPAIHRRLEELPPGSQVWVLAQADEADQRAFQTQAVVTVQWLRTDDELINALRQLDLPAGDGFVWGAGEASAMAQVRQVLRDDKQFPLTSTRVSAYWKRGAADFHEER